MKVAYKTMWSNLNNDNTESHNDNLKMVLSLFEYLNVSEAEMAALLNPSVSCFFDHYF